MKTNQNQKAAKHRADRDLKAAAFDPTKPLRRVRGRAKHRKPEGEKAVRALLESMPINGWWGKR